MATKHLETSIVFVASGKEIMINERDFDPEIHFKTKNRIPVQSGPISGNPEESEISDTEAASEKGPSTESGKAASDDSDHADKPARRRGRPPRKQEGAE